MIFDTLALFTLAFAVLVSPVSGNPSAVPHNGYTCPQQDKGNFAVGVTNYASDPILCAYPITQGSSDTTFNCQYSAATGALITDSDDANCPETGVTPVQRRSSRVARAPLPSRPLVNRGVPAGPADKAYLKKRRS